MIGKIFKYGSYLFWIICVLSYSLVDNDKQTIFFLVLSILLNYIYQELTEWKNRI